MVESFLTSELFVELILPFVLVFTLIFAILQKTQLLGEGKKQIDALVGLVVGLILIASPFKYIIIQLMPFLAISAVVLLIFMLLYGFVMNKKEDVLHKGVKITLGIILGLALITVLLIITGSWDPIYNFMFNNENAATIWINVLLILVIAGAMVGVLVGRDNSSSSS